MVCVVCGLGFEVWDLRFGVSGLGLTVRELVSVVWCLVFGVWGLGICVISVLRFGEWG